MEIRRVGENYRSQMEIEWHQNIAGETLSNGREIHSVSFYEDDIFPSFNFFSFVFFGRGSPNRTVADHSNFNKQLCNKKSVLA
jgi:hypothetical protein